ADSYVNIGLIHYDRGQYAEALDNYFPAMKIYEQGENKDGMAAVYICLGNVYTKEKNFGDAREYLLKALNIAKEVGGKDNLRDCYSGLAELAETSGDLKGAYGYYKLYSDIKDTLLNDNNNRQIAEMKIKYESEKKDNEIALLNSENKVKEAEV